jgi:hypothetical protein
MTLSRVIQACLTLLHAANFALAFILILIPPHTMTGQKLYKAWRHKYATGPAATLFWLRYCSFILYTPFNYIDDPLSVTYHVTMIVYGLTILELEKARVMTGSQLQTRSRSTMHKWGLHIYWSTKRAMIRAILSVVQRANPLMMIKILKRWVSHWEVSFVIHITLTTDDHRRFRSI